MKGHPITTFLRHISPAWRRRLAWALVLAAPVLELWLIYCYAVNVPIWDEWNLVPFLKEIHEGGDWWPWVFKQHNEHRVAALRLPLAVIAEWTDWNVVPQMYFGFLLQLVTLLGLWRVLARSFDRDPLRFAPIAFLSFALIGYTIFLYGMMYVWSMLLATVVWSLWLLSRQTWPGLAGAVTCALVASFTIINGLLVWPLGLLLLLLGKEKIARLVVWVVVGLTVIGFYYRGYAHPPYHPSLLEPLHRPLAAASFLLANLGASFGAGSYWASCAFGAALAVLLLIVGWQRLPRWREWSREERVVFCLLMFALASSAAVVASRLGLNLRFAIEPRYACVTVLVSIALYFELFGRRGLEAARSSPLAHAFATMLAIGYAGTSIYAWEQLVDWSRVRQHQVTQLAEIDRLPDAELAGVFPDPSRLRGFVDYMRPRRLGPFVDVKPRDIGLDAGLDTRPVGTLRVQRWREGTTAAEIIPGQEVVQRFRCPVETLTDLAVPFATYGRRNRGHVTLVLSAGDGELGRSQVPAATVEPNGWVSLTPSEPLLRCHGRELVLVVSSDDGTHGSALTVWTYPSYYEGKLYQKGGPDLTGRSLGLEINRGPR